MYLNFEDYQPVVKQGQVEPIPPKRKAEKTDESQPGKKEEGRHPAKKKGMVTYNPSKHKAVAIPASIWLQLLEKSTIPSAAGSSSSVCVGGFLGLTVNTELGLQATVA